MTRIVVSLAPLVLAATVAGQSVPAASTLSIIPQPTTIVRHEGAFVVSPETVISVADATQDLGYVVAGVLAPATGFHLPVRLGDVPSSPAIVLRVEGALSSLGQEGYRLDITGERVTIRGAAPAGVFYGIQTLRQLLPPEI